LTRARSASSRVGNVFITTEVNRRPVLAVFCDSLVIIGVLLSHGHIVAASAAADGTTWVLVLASTAVFIPQLMLSPWWACRSRE
jgi:hypothetical protein